MADCSLLLTAYNAAVAGGDEATIAAALAALEANNCDAPDGSGGHGPVEPGHG